MKLLDLSKFEKIAEDKHTATMKHKDGHTMVIMMRALPPIHREQLKRLKMAAGGAAEEPMDDFDDTETPAKTPAPDASTAAADAVSDPGSVQSAPLEFPAAQALSQDPSVTTPAPIPGNLMNPLNAVQAPADSVAMSGRAADLGVKIAAAQSAGQQAIAAQKAAVEQEYQNKVSTNLDDMAKHASDLDTWSRNNPQDSKAYYNSLSDSGKSDVALGLVLGGLGGPGNNAAMDYLNKQIDRSVNDQAANWERQKNIYGAYQQLYGDKNVSANLTKVSMNNKILADSDRLTAILGTPQAAKANMDLKAKTLQENADILKKNAMYYTALGGQNGGSPAATPTTAGASLEPSGGGKPTVGPESADKNGIYTPHPILVPNAKQKFNNLALAADAGDPTAIARLSDAKTQYADAKQRDEMLKQVPALFESLRQNATPGGWINRNIDIESAPGEGWVPSVIHAGSKYAGSITNAAGDAISKTYNSIRGNNDHSENEELPSRKEENYNIAKNQLADFLSKAYPHSTGAERNEKLQGILNDFNSNPENVKRHIKSFEDLVKTGGQYNALQDAGIAYP